VIRIATGEEPEERRAKTQPPWRWAGKAEGGERRA
jgi:hypothetical protein